MDIEKLKTQMQEIIDRVILPPYLVEILAKLSNGTLSASIVEEACSKHNISEAVAKVSFLRFILEYLQSALLDNLLSTDEKEVVAMFKRAFRIRPGDFLFHFKDGVEQIIFKQLANIYGNNVISSEEAQLKVDLQEIFDLSYDQMNEYAKQEARIALKQGANLQDLDIFFPYKEYIALKDNLEIPNGKVR